MVRLARHSGFAVGQRSVPKSNSIFYFLCYWLVYPDFHSLKIDSSQATILNKRILPADTREVKLRATGSGIGLVQVWRLTHFFLIFLFMVTNQAHWNRDAVTSLSSSEGAHDLWKKQAENMLCLVTTPGFVQVGYEFNVDVVGAWPSFVVNPQVFRPSTQDHLQVTSMPI